MSLPPRLLFLELVDDCLWRHSLAVDSDFELEESTDLRTATSLVFRSMRGSLSFPRALLVLLPTFAAASTGNFFVF
eukprot:TRINITY_DN8094_c0_g1_i1.p2 TRINITY_DN8094_c0_g1~~TRINITY_DN8094_c0_g1_i1.p2  ORF type:complete len:76 (+),score=9.73 TRINITY_DN8094_c0_g1_i1:263-490(+)